MMAPTKEQVLKRLAEIEGLEVVNDRLWHRQNADGTADWITWDPLDNPADTFALVEKYKISHIWLEHARLWETLCEDDAPGYGYHTSLPYAICLAVIEANGGMVEEEAE